MDNRKCEFIIILLMMNFSKRPCLFQLKKNASQTRFQGLPTESPHVPGQTAARYMKRLLSPSSQDRTPLPNKQVTRKEKKLWTEISYGTNKAVRKEI